MSRILWIIIDYEYSDTLNPKYFLICIILHQNPAKWIMNQKGTADQDDVNDVIKHRFDLFDAKRWRIASQVAERASAKDVLQLLQLEGAHGAHGPVPGHGSNMEHPWNIHWSTQI